MWPSQRLMFYTSPRLNGLRARLWRWAAIWAAILFAEFFFIPSGCVMTPSMDISTLAAFNQHACTSAEIGAHLLLYAGIALVIVLVFALVTQFVPDRYLALTITARGLKSVSSRFPQPIIGWEDIESLGIYQDAARPDPRRPLCYLAVTVHSSEGMHDSEVMEQLWRQYPQAPAMDRVALMLRLERPTDASGKKITAADVIERIQICFPDEITENGVEVIEGVRLV